MQVNDENEPLSLEQRVGVGDDGVRDMFT
jgi:hypothetical protein